MVRKWVTWINYSACAVIALLLLSTLYFVFMRQTSFSVDHEAIRKLELPKGSFRRPPEEYEALGAPAFSLDFSPLSVQLPDLRRYLVYYGKNGRPDVQSDKQALYFAFTGNKTPTGLFSGERLYLLYDKSLTPNQYVFSPNNAETPIWIEATAQGNQAIVKVTMQGKDGVLIRTPAAYAQITLPEKEFIRTGSAPWELGKWRVDGTLLAKQKGRWFGVDKFLEKHGGKEYQDFVDKQRIDFGEGQDVYSVYVGPTDCLIWKDDRWRSVPAGDASLAYPLMCVKKIDDRVMNLELWDVGGKAKVNLNLVKAGEVWAPQNLEQQFKFVGARTRTQFVFEINKERVLLRPHDWLLFRDSAWKKLVTPQQIDDYVERRTIGPLFVLDRVERKDDKQIVIGTFFNTARTDAVTVELSLQQSSSSAGQNPLAPNRDKKQKTKEKNPASVIKTEKKADKIPLNAQIPELPRPVRKEKERDNSENHK